MPPFAYLFPRNSGWSTNYKAMFARFMTEGKTDTGIQKKKKKRKEKKIDGNQAFFRDTDLNSGKKIPCIFKAF